MISHASDQDHAQTIGRQRQVLHHALGQSLWPILCPYTTCLKAGCIVINYEAEGIRRPSRNDSCVSNPAEACLCSVLLCCIFARKHEFIIFSTHTMKHVAAVSESGVDKAEPGEETVRSSKSSWKMDCKASAWEQSQCYQWLPHTATRMLIRIRIFYTLHWKLHSNELQPQIASSKNCKFWLNHRVAS